MRGGEKWSYHRRGTVYLSTNKRIESNESTIAWLSSKGVRRSELKAFDPRDSGGGKGMGTLT